MLHRSCWLWRVNTKNSLTCLQLSEISTDFPFLPSFLTYIKALTPPPLPVSSPKRLWHLLSHSITSVSKTLIQQFQWFYFSRVTKPLNSQAFATKTELKQLQWYTEEPNQVKTLIKLTAQLIKVEDLVMASSSSNNWSYRLFKVLEWKWTCV